MGSRRPTAHTWGVLMMMTLMTLMTLMMMMLMLMLMMLMMMMKCFLLDLPGHVPTTMQGRLPSSFETPHCLRGHPRNLLTGCAACSKAGAYVCQGWNGTKTVTALFASGTVPPPRHPKPTYDPWSSV